MEDRFKFRVLEISNGAPGHRHETPFWKYFKLLTALDPFRYDLQTIVQCTGLQDIKGTDIYEGDILEWAEVRASVEWCDSDAMYYLQEECNHDMDFCESTLIVGNIHENPEIVIGVTINK